MAYQWDMIASDPPAMRLYNNVFGDTDNEDGDHAYLIDAFLTPIHDIPGIPSRYAAEESEGRVLYIRGAPEAWESGMMRAIFGLWGRVEKLPVMISLSAEKTFRWVVMGTEEQALIAMDKLHGRVLEHSCLMISKSLPPGRTITLVNKAALAEQPEIGEGEDEDDEDPKTPMPKLYHGHPPSIVDTSDQKTPTQPKFPETKIVEIEVEESDDGEEIKSPEIPQPNQTPLTSPAKEEKKDTFVTQAASWANIAGAASPGTRVIDLKPEYKSTPTGPRLKPVGRIPSVTRSIDQDAARLVFLLNLPSTITPTDITNAVKEGPLVKMQFGFDAEVGSRYCGVIFQYARDAAAFEEILDMEKRESKPERFRFIVDHARSEQVMGIEDTLKAMGPPMYATRRLTIVKAGFFFMLGQRQLKDICEKLVGEECVQLIWLYNGGNATVVFTDVSAAVRVKRDFDRKATHALSGGEGSEAIWAGVLTTFSKDPCVFPLELKTTIHE
ncbi:hypothetical protein EG329_006000 [Mollisiaceae sp. DMI_Dod_QoI]|nr:hypothetical protein EG329_006000 [Helotiales sp. DMI_Dod_QoI]